MRSYLPGENFNGNLNPVIGFIILIGRRIYSRVRNGLTGLRNVVDRNLVIIVAYDTVTAQMVRLILSTRVFSHLTLCEMADRHHIVTVTVVIYSREIISQYLCDSSLDLCRCRL